MSCSYNNTFTINDVQLAMKVEKQIMKKHATNKNNDIVSNQGIQNLKSSLRPSALKEVEKIETNKLINPNN